MLESTGEIDDMELQFRVPKSSLLGPKIFIKPPEDVSHVYAKTD